jgi:dihydrofolate synthase/folylpolyglutamate synthase
MNERSRYIEIENQLEQISSPGIHPGLERILRLFECLGHPEKSFPAIHIVGTNGKGSTSAYIESILRESGMRTAMYTSPHLVHMGERLLINGHALSCEKWEEAAQKVISTVKENAQLALDPPTYFEIFTATAFLLIASFDVDIAVIEAGMGGRLDATNTLGNVLLTIITPISKDHMEYLGDTLEAIAMEKFAVIRKGVPALFAGGSHTLCSLFKTECLKKETQGVIVPETYTVSTKNVSLQGATFTLTHNNGNVYADIHTPLIGTHQIANSAVALASMDILRNKMDKITEQSIRRGLAKTCWPGRMELIKHTPPIILDGAHNDDGITKLVESLKTLGINNDKEKLAIVYASMKDKEHDIALKKLSGLKPHLFCTEVPEMERSAKAEFLRKEALQYTWASTPKGISDPREAIYNACQDSSIVVCCGSLYLIGYIKSFILQEATFCNEL